MFHEPNYEAEPCRFGDLKGWHIGTEDGKDFFRLEDGRVLFLLQDAPNEFHIVEETKVEEPKKPKERRKKKADG